MNSAKNRSVLCVDIGGTSTKAGLVDVHGQVRFLDSIPTKPTSETYFQALAELIAKVQDHEHPPTRMGVAVAGFLDPERTRLVHNSNLSWLEGFPLRDRLAQRFPALAIELEIDSNAATMAEYSLGSGHGSHRFLCVTAGTGLGVGMTVDGVPLRFAYGCLGDIGHVIVLRNGPLCTCGGRGCAEVMISAPLLAQQYKTAAALLPHDVSLRDVIEAAQSGDGAAVSVLEQAGEWLGVALASFANIFFPDYIAIAGGLSAAGDLVLKPAERVFRECACELARSKATLAQAALGSTATLVGAAWPFWKEQEE
ncbi:MAG: ROK family protein [Acidobacteriota bacterium]|nr:ROK family protein [Acidobacteriota bacterium]